MLFTKIGKKKIEKYIFVSLMAGLTFVLTGCDKQLSDYKVETVFSYTDIQETKRDYSESTDDPLEDEFTAEVESPEGGDDWQISPDRPIDDPNDPRNSWRNPGSRTSNAGTDTNSYEDTSDNSSSGGAGDSGYADAGDGSGGEGSGGEGGTGENGSGGTGDNGKGNGKSGSGDDKKKEEPAKTPKAYGLEYEGDLGRYIWGEDADTSNIHIYYTAEGGRKEITDYEITMDYPELVTFSETIHTGSQGTTTFEPYEPGIYNAMVTYGKYYCQVPYELDIVYITMDFYLTNYCIDASHRDDIVYDDEGFATEKYYSDGLYGTNTDLTSTFPGYTYCKNCSAIWSTTAVEKVQYEVTVDDTTYFDYKDINMTTYGCKVGHWKVMYPITGDYEFTREEFNKIGVTEDYTTYADYQYDTLDTDKEEMMGYEWESDYVYNAGTYVKYYTVAPEGVDLSWISE